MFYLYCFTYTGLFIFGAYIYNMRSLFLCVYFIDVCLNVFFSIDVFILHDDHSLFSRCPSELGALADCQVSAWSPGQLEPKSGRGTSGDGKFAPNSWAFHGILHGDSPIESFRRCFLFIFVPHEDAFFCPRMIWPYVHQKK